LVLGHPLDIPLRLHASEFGTDVKTDVYKEEDTSDVEMGDGDDDLGVGYAVVLWSSID
jgi:hypothetical protein